MPVLQQPASTTAISSSADIFENDVLMRVTMAEIRKTGLHFPCLSVFIVIEYSLCEFESRLVTGAGDTAGVRLTQGQGLARAETIRTIGDTKQTQS